MKARELIRRLTEAVDEYGADMWIDVYPHDEPTAGDEIWGVYVEGDTVRLSTS